MTQFENRGQLVKRLKVVGEAKEELWDTYYVGETNIPPAIQAKSVEDSN
jgi:hypothetical protein